MKKTVLLQAPIYTRSGYGDHARDLAAAILSSDDYTLEIFATNWGNTSWDGLDKDNEIHSKIDQCATQSPTPNPDIFIQLTIPNEFVRAGRYNIGVTAGIETDLCRPEWITGCNNMDMIIGVSNHTIKVLQESKYEKRDKNTNEVIEMHGLRPNLKTEVLFEGVSPNLFDSSKVKDKNLIKHLNQIEESFCFLFVGHWLEGNIGQDRKDVGMLIKVYCEAFKLKSMKNTPALILKTSGSSFSITDREEINNKIRFILRGYKKEFPIYVIHGNLTENQMATLYNHKKIKAMVSFTKGEGFGRPLLEFTTTGKPVIASNWSGQTDFLSSEHSILLPGDLTPVHGSVVNDWFMAEAKWFTVNYPYAVKALQAVCENYDVYLAKAAQQRKETLEKFTLEKMNEKLIEILDSISVVVELKLPKLKLPKLEKSTM